MRTLAALLVAAACARSSSPTEAAETPAHAEAPMQALPPLPEDVLLQLFNRHTGQTWRIALDGRYLVTPPGGVERQETPLSQLAPGQPVLPAGSLEHLREALRSAGFFSLPARLEGTLPSGPVVLPSGRGPFTPQAWAFSARDGSRTATVEVTADPRVPSTLGALAPLYAALDQVALGDWRKR